MIEQINIRKAELSQRFLKKKGDESNLDDLLKEQKQILAKVQGEIEELKQEEAQLSRRQKEWADKLEQTNRSIEADTAEYHKVSSRLESLKNIAERYDGYGVSIRKIMEQKDREAGLLGVVSDLIRVQKKYETAIETALGLIRKR